MDTDFTSPQPFPQSGEGEELTPLERFTSLLGDDVFFVPCEWGTKVPLVTYIERCSMRPKPISRSISARLGRFMRD